MATDTTDLNEGMMFNRIEEGADLTYKRWPTLVRMLENGSVLAKTRGVFAEDVWALGQMLRQWENYHRYCESAGVLADLGQIPKHALEIITADFGTSIVPHIASVQPIHERMGIIYFRTVKARATRGNVTDGDTLIHPFYPPNHNGTPNYPEGFAGEKVASTITLDGDPSTDTVFEGTTAIASPYLPIRPRSVEVTVITSGGTVLRAIDDGNNSLLGNGFHGTIDYTVSGAGKVWLYFTAAPGAGVVPQITYATDFEESGNVPEVNFTIDTTDISAEIFALTQGVGLFKAFEFQNRFGQSSEDMIARDLVGSLNLEIGNTAVSRLIASSIGSTDFNVIPPQYISYQDHMLQLKAKLAMASSTILNNAGRGYVNYLICGSSAAATLSTLPGWQQQVIDTPGCNIWGTLDGMTVIRAPHINPNHIYCVYKGKGGFDTPLVWSPYMPLVVSKTLQDIDNILKNRNVAAVWGGLKVVAPTFCTRVVLVQAAYTTPSHTP